MMFRCECGKALRVPDESAGKKVRCPACQAVQTAPAEDDIPIAEPVYGPPPTPPEPPPTPFQFAGADEPAEEQPRPKKKKLVAEVAEPAEKKPRKAWKKDDDEDEKPAQPPTPPWAWVFVVACGIIPVLTLGGAIPMMIGFGGVGGVLGAARDQNKSVGTRVGICIGIVVLCWVLVAALIGGLAVLMK